MKSKEVLVNATNLAKLNIFLQIFLRFFTFITNAIILRNLDRDLFGLINVRLILLYTTCQLLSREATRRACTSESKLYNWNASVNCIWLNIPVSMIVGFILSYIWTKVINLPDEKILIEYNYSVYMIILSVLIELFVEPIYIYGHLNNFIKSRIFIEGFVQIFKTFSLLIVVLNDNNQKNILSKFANISVLSSTIYMIFYLIVYFFIKKNEKISFRPTLKNNNETFKLLVIIWAFMKQTVLKQFLTEGERFVMTFFNLINFEDQGIYHAINNLSSIAARFIFAPVEESVYLIFAQLLNRNVSIDKQDKENLKISDQVLKNILKLMIIFGLTIIVFGYNYSHLVLLVYGGFKFCTDNAIILMKCQCFYISIIAINGITETFTFASMNQKQLNNFNFVMIFLSILFLFSSYFLVKLVGLPGFVLSVCIQMIGRILFSFYFIRNSFPNNYLKDYLPNKKLFFEYIILFIILYTLKPYFCCFDLKNSIVFVIFGLISILIICFSIMKLEKKLINFLLYELRHVKKD